MTTYRALFDLMGIPYIGNRADVMATAADKSRARAIVAAAGVAVPTGEVLRRGERPTLTPPVVVKPVDADNSLGVSLVREAAQYAGAVDEALAHSERALVERYIDLGHEVRCGVIEVDGELRCLPIEEYAVDPATKPIRTHRDKLDRTGDGELYLVAKDRGHAWIVDPGHPMCAAVHAAARRCHVALGCRHHSLFDFRVDDQGTPWFLEASLYCSFSPQSVISMMASAAGLDVVDLFASAVREALSGGLACSKS